MKYTIMICLIGINVVIFGCSQKNIKSSKVNKITDCKGIKSANSIVEINGRTLLVYDKNLDKDCGSL